MMIPLSRTAVLSEGCFLLGNQVVEVFFVGSVDGRNPAPPGLYKTLYQPQLVNAGFLNHQQVCSRHLLEIS